MRNFAGSLSRLTIIVLSIVAGGCATVDFDSPKEPSYVITDVDGTKLGKVALEWAEIHSDQTGVSPLPEGIDALGARLRLIEAAELSIDAQYFLMKGDTAGELFAGALLQAADRGVRIRLLLDDVFTTVKDDELELLDQHPNIELRLFNPISRRGLYYLNYAGDFSRANRRMHSKSITADNSMTIVGGRNIADEYFQLRDDGEFLDFDVLAIGPVVAEISDQFDDFWNNDRAIPVLALDKRASEKDLQTIRDQIAEEMAHELHPIYERAVNSEYMLELINGAAQFYVANAYLIADEASKLENPVGDEFMTVANELVAILEQAESDVVIINPYFIPQADGVEFWRGLEAKGVDVTVITNSLASTNHVPVHSAYTRYRKPMLELGADMYEARVDAVEKSSTADKLTLHTKLMVIDQRYIFVGSLNLDPRAININAEMGLMIDSAEMAQEFMADLENGVEARTYKLRLDERNKLVWETVIDDEPVTETKEPLTSGWRRFLSGFYRVLPEGQL